MFKNYKVHYQVAIPELRSNTITCILGCCLHKKFSQVLYKSSFCKDVLSCHPVLYAKENSKCASGNSMGEIDPYLSATDERCRMAE